VDRVLSPPERFWSTLKTLGQDQSDKDYSNEISAETARDVEMTVFWPNNAAWATASNLLTGATIEQAQQLYEAHIVKGSRFLLQDLEDQVLTTNTDQEIRFGKFSIGPQGIDVNNGSFGEMRFEITEPDIFFNGGVLHLIDRWVPHRCILCHHCLTDGCQGVEYV
jgi:hypothetical protein